MLRDAGSVVGLAVQVLLALVGMAVVSEALEGEPGPLLLIWCLVGTCYLLVMVVAVGVDSLHRRPFPPTRVQANVVVRWTSLSASLITAAVGLVAAFMILIGDPDQDIHTFFKAVGIWAIVLAWGLMHWGFAQLYFAHYYADEPGLEFPGTTEPDLVDFTYFAFLIGTTFATTDVTVTGRRDRWRVMMHSVLTFFFNSSILVLAVSSLTG